MNSTENTGKFKVEIKTYLQCVPERYSRGQFELREAVVGHFNKALAALRDGKCVTLTGGRGSGKTHMAVGLMRQIAMESKGESYVDKPHYQDRIELNFCFYRVADFYVDLKSNWTDGAGNIQQRTEREVIEDYCSGEVIVFDDLGIEKVSDWSRQLLYTLIDKMYGECKRVIFTSNLSLKEISDKIDDRIASRLMEMGPVINIGNKDERREIAKQWSA
jgi:DNA replication protein DnaC